MPGKFMLSYLPRNKVRHEYITVTPEGYRFRQQMFDSVASVFKWFKEHFREPLPGGITPGTPRLSSGRTPYGSGTPFSKYLENFTIDTRKCYALYLPGTIIYFSS